MKVITLINEKGGIGKTTLATYLAVGLALKGFRVLFIDSTPQADATSVLGLKEEPGFMALIMQDAAWRDVMRQVPRDVWGVADGNGSLYAIPSNQRISRVWENINMEVVLGFRSKMQEIDTLFDFVIFDTQPNPSRTHDAVLFTTDYVIVPTQPEGFSALRATSATLDSVQRIHHYGQQAGLELAQVIGIQPNLVRNVSLHEAVLKAMTETYGALVWGSVMERIAIAESQLSQRFLLSVAPELKSTGELWGFVDNTLQAIGIGHEQN